MVSTASYNITNAMEQFKIEQPTKAQIIGKLSLQLLPAILLVTAGLLTIRLFHLSSLTVYRIALSICIIALLAIYFVGWRKLVSIYQSYRLTVSGNVIMREQANAPIIKLSFSEVNEITKHPNGSYTIKGRSSNDVIDVPPYINDTPTLERVLNEIRPIVQSAS